MNKLEANLYNIDEQDLVERLKKGQQWAFNILVNQYQGRLLKIAYGITLNREDSLEIVQDVFISVFKNIQTFRQEGSLVTWLRKITLNRPEDYVFEGDCNSILLEKVFPRGTIKRCGNS